MRRLRIAQVAPPYERVPPLGYGGSERIVDELVRELTRRGHEVTTFASGDSEVPGRLVPTVVRALRPTGFSGDPTPYLVRTQLEVLARADEFDLGGVETEVVESAQQSGAVEAPQIVLGRRCAVHHGAFLCPARYSCAFARSRRRLQPPAGPGR